MSTTRNTVIYANGLFGTNDPPTNARQTAELKRAQFGTALLWTLHVHGNGDFYYNDAPMVQQGTFNSALAYMAPLVKALPDGGGVHQVYFGIGSGGAADFAAIKELLASEAGSKGLVSNFHALLRTIPVVGFDFDLEEFPLEDYTSTIVQLTLLLQRQFGSGITYCPYTEPNFWRDCLARVYASAGRQLVRWYNLQCYDGGQYNSPAEWAEGLASSPAPLGIASPAAFIVPGYWARHKTDGGSYSGDCPDAVRSTFQKLSRSLPGIDGGFMWNSGDIFANEQSGACGTAPMTIAAYSTAIVSGLGG